jgi:hypothetical protein
MNHTELKIIEYPKSWKKKLNMSLDIQNNKKIIPLSIWLFLIQRKYLHLVNIQKLRFGQKNQMALIVYLINKKE